MSTPAPQTPSATPAPDNTRWTGEKAADFLRHLSRHGKAAKAARSVGMSRQAAYRLRARAPRFAEMWDWAMREAAARRAEALSAGRAAVHPLLARGQGDALTPQGSHTAAAGSHFAGQG